MSSSGTNPILKWGSYIFMGFLVILITISFGMPNFISSSATADRFISARVGDQVITRRELARVKNNVIQSRFAGQNLPEFQLKFLESSILEQLIQNRVMLIFAKKYGFYPGSKARRKLFADYLKKNHADFLVGSKFDFQRFERQFLTPNQLTLSEYESLLTQEQGLRMMDSMLRSTAPVSDYAILGELQKKNTKYSVEIVAIAPAEKNKWVDKHLTVSPVEIQARFEKDYLSKDKKAVLNKTKREAIAAILKNEKRPVVEKSLMDELRKLSASGSIPAIARRFGVKPILLNDVDLMTSLNTLKPQDAPDLSVLETDVAFQQNLLKGESKNIYGPLSKSGSLYLYRVVAFKKSDLPTAQDLKKAQKSLEALLPSHKDEIERLRNEWKDTVQREAQQNIFEALKQKVKIVRLKQEAS